MKPFVLLPIAAALAGLFWVCPAWADTPAPDFRPLFQSAAAELAVSPAVTQAIARVESRVWPYTLNIEGQPFFFASKKEALAAARRALAEGKSFDTGIMQINSQWLRRYNLPLEAVLDPAANIYLGSWILSREMARNGDTWQAVARYHSPNQSQGRTYVEQVKAALRRKTGTKTAVKSSRPAAGQLLNSAALDAPLVPAAPEESKGKNISADKNVFTREPAPQPQLVVYRADDAPTKRESPISAIKQDKAPSAFVQHLGGPPVFTRQAASQ